MPEQPFVRRTLVRFVMKRSHSARRTNKSFAGQLTPMKRFIVAITLCALAAHFAPPVGAQRSAVETYAITNARIFPVNGPVIERGTVVIRGGLIVAVGAQVTAPADARIID